MKFLYSDVSQPTLDPFNYYKYMGSMTSPPCEESVVWFVVAQPLEIGTTALTLIRDALNVPGTSSADLKDNYDGSNRYFQNSDKSKRSRTDKCSTSTAPNATRLSSRPPNNPRDIGRK